MELFRDTNIDFLGKARVAIIISLALVAATIFSLVTKGPRWGIDFRGGTLVYVMFAEQPPIEQIRSALEEKIPGEITVQDITGSREVIIGTEVADESQLNAARQIITATLEERFGETGGKPDFNNVGQQAIAEHLRLPLQNASVPLSEQELQELAGRMLAFRDNARSGVLRSFDELSAVQGVTPAVIKVMKEEVGLSPFSIRQVEIVGPKVGADLRKKALLATLYALGGMLVYVAFRFELAAGVAAVVAVAHDAFLTIGFLSFFDREISLTVIAALLTLVGYSMNDTIVIFDRVRENLKLRMREQLPVLVNRSMNQTLSRTVLTTGLTLISVLSLYFLGGPVLNGIAFTLLVGLIVGTYSTIFIASPLVVAWHGYAERRKSSRVGSQVSPAVSNRKEAVRRSSSKAAK